MLLGLLFQSPLIFIPLILALLVALSFHELSHGIVAYWLGDSTAKDAGRLTMNPISHIDPMGAILLLLVGFGWGKPVPVNYYNLSMGKWGPAVVAIAGPLSNLIMVAFFGIWFKLIAPAGLNPVDISSVIIQNGNLLLVFLSFCVVYNIILMLFNLIPIPPLDGSKVLFALMPPGNEDLKIFLQTKGPMLLFALLIIDAVTNIGIFAWLFNGILNLFAGFFM